MPSRQLNIGPRALLFVLQHATVVVLPFNQKKRYERPQVYVSGSDIVQQHTYD